MAGLVCADRTDEDVIRWRKRTRTSRSDPSQLVPPEGVPVHLKIAGVGVRMAAQITDILITGCAALAVVFLAVFLNAVSMIGFLAIASFAFFLIRIPYYVLFELMWNGQTLGKRIMKIKVVSHDGGTLTTHAIVLRNLMKEAEIFLPITLLLSLDASSPIGSLIGTMWVLMTLAIPLGNRYRRRLGDFLAGTHVVHLPQPILLKDLASGRAPAAVDGTEFSFLPYQLDHYGAFELQTLERVLRVEGNVDQVRHNETLSAIVEKIRQKIGYADAVTPNNRTAFLKAFYAAQRAHLEQRQLFGDRRVDKHHATAEKDP
ncbi:RDD family protein [Gymnodinialimonas sp. 2305UL16-5]|uniref:RDD family protein n=1 Tax=Gymnodinialimonas mytili TaxID=3126503 RepID=UPI0030A8A659